MSEKKIILIVDYSCHPFSLDLANQLSEDHLDIKYLFSKKINLTKDFYKLYKKNFSIYPIDVGNIPKHNFILRRFKEIKFGKKVIDEIIRFKPKKVLLANLPIDTLYNVIKFCKKNNIETFFWIQDIYYLAIKSVLKKNYLLYFVFGFFISKLYEYLEKYCYLNSTKNILITKKFLNFYPPRKNNFIIENWVPLNMKKIKNRKRKYFLNIQKNKFNFLYTGTFSYKHKSNILLTLADKIKNSNIIILSNDKFAKDLLLDAKKKNINNIF